MNIGDIYIYSFFSWYISTINPSEILVIRDIFPKRLLEKLPRTGDVLQVGHGHM